MDKCDVLIVGGGPAGAACAWKLRQASFDVIVVDRKEFPRDKVCGGWVTPQVLDELQFDTDEYRQHRVFQPIRRFITGMINGSEIVTDYHRPVSYGIRRFEFDNYLLRRTRARLRLGTTFQSLHKVADDWVLNSSIRAPIVVGAGGNFCPVARNLGCLPKDSVADEQPTVVAQEAEFELTDEEQQECSVEQDRPELLFCPDLKGYGWIFRKGKFINIGLGREGETNLSSHVHQFVQGLVERGKVPKRALTEKYCGHAYRLRAAAPLQSKVENVLIIGDAAGLATPESGEGIRPAIESGLLAAASILEHRDRESRRPNLIELYDSKLRNRFGEPHSRTGIQLVPSPIRSMVARWLMGSHWFTRRVVLDRWFLNVSQAPLSV